jgi:hypothetical protein
MAPADRLNTSIPINALTSSLCSTSVASELAKSQLVWKQLRVWRYFHADNKKDGQLLRVKPC